MELVFSFADSRGEEMREAPRLASARRASFFFSFSVLFLLLKLSLSFFSR